MDKKVSFRTPREVALWILANPLQLLPAFWVEWPEKGAPFVRVKDHGQYNKAVKGGISQLDNLTRQITLTNSEGFDVDALPEGWNPPLEDPKAAKPTPTAAKPAATLPTAAKAEAKPEPVVTKEDKKAAAAALNANSSKPQPKAEKIEAEIENIEDILSDADLIYNEIVEMLEENQLLDGSFNDFLDLCASGSEEESSSDLVPNPDYDQSREDNLTLMIEAAEEMQDEEEITRFKAKLAAHKATKVMPTEDTEVAEPVGREYFAVQLYALLEENIEFLRSIAKIARGQEEEVEA